MKQQVQPSISFLVSTRNRAKIVHDCISHLLDSGRSDIEVIVRDNNLTDNTWTTIQKIKDSRLKVYRSPIDQGTFGFMELSKLPSGKIVTWISDEDEFQFEHLDWILSQFSNPECNILFGSIHVGKNGRLIFPEEAIYDQVRASLVELSFSGCDGLFIRNERLHHANSLKCSNVDDGYVLWNNYPIGFFASRCGSIPLITTSKIVVKQVRFAKTTNNWNVLPKTTHRLPHYYPETMFDRLVSNIVNVHYKKILIKEKIKIVYLLISSFLNAVENLENPGLIKLLHENYDQAIVEKYINHINSLKLNKKLTRSFWLLNKMIGLLPAVFRNKAKWKKMKA